MKGVSVTEVSRVERGPSSFSDSYGATTSVYGPRRPGVYLPLTFLLYTGKVNGDTTPRRKPRLPTDQQLRVTSH